MTGGGEAAEPGSRGFAGGAGWSRSAPRPQVHEPGDPPQFPAFPRRESAQVYDSPWCGLRRDVVELPGGKPQEYHVFEITNAVAVVPVLEDGSILMLWQYRYPHGRSHWEIPAGRMNEDEDPAETARRELLEETGHAAKQLLPMPGFFPTNGISAHYAHLFLGIGCTPDGPAEPDASEQILLRPFARDQVRARLRRGTFADGFTALALFYALDHLEETER